MTTVNRSPDRDQPSMKPGEDAVTSHRIERYSDFWLHYLREHSRPATRAWHYVGTTLALGLVVLAAVTGNPWWLLGSLVAGYGFAWAGHALAEHNHPATFTYAAWSFVSDLRMFALFVTGRLGPELERARRDPKADDPATQSPGNRPT